MSFTKRHRSIMLILLLTLLAIALVWWLFDKRLRQLDGKGKTSVYIQPDRASVSNYTLIHFKKLL